MNLRTPYVESLTSYFARLAKVHHISARTLFDDVIYREVGTYSKNATFTNYAKLLNGINDSARKTAIHLQSALGETKLTSLTMLQFEGIISYYGLIRPNHAYCPYCYEEQRLSGSPVHDFLVWSLENVSICSKHHCRLEHSCIFCGATFMRLSRFYQPGFCPKCLCWLGRSMSESDNNKESNQNFESFCADALGELFEKHITISAVIPQQTLSTLIDSAINKFSNGNISAFGRLTHIPIVNRFTFQNASVHTIYNLLKICYYTNIKLSTLLFKHEIEQDVRQITHLAQPQLAHTKKKPRARDGSRKVNGETALRNALNALEPISVCAVAAKVDVKKSSILYEWYPDLCKQVAANFSAYEAHNSQTRLAGLCNAVKTAARQLHSQKTYPSKNKVVKLSGVGANIRTPEVYQAWKAALNELGYNTNFEH